jgi:uncharacterized small protein (DUF1192 family)
LSQIAKVWRDKHALEDTIRALNGELRELKSNGEVNGEIGVGVLAQAEIDRFNSIIADHKTFILNLQGQIHTLKSKKVVKGGMEGVGGLAQGEIDRFNSIIAEHKALILDLQAQIRGYITDKQNYLEAGDRRNVEIAEINKDNVIMFNNLQAKIATLTDQLNRVTADANIFSANVATLNAQLAEATAGTIAENILPKYAALDYQFEQVVHENHTLSFQMNNYIKEKNEMAGEQDREKHRRAGEMVCLRVRIAKLQDENKKMQTAFDYAAKNGVELPAPAFEKI